MLIKRDFYRIAVRSRLTFLKFLSKRKKNNADSPQAVVPSEGLGLITVPDAGEEQEKTDKNADFSAFYALAELLNVSVERIKDECCLFQIRNVMKRLGKVIVRYNVTDAELSDVFLNCAALEIKELLVSPAYISACRKQVGRHGLNSLYVDKMREINAYRGKKPVRVLGNVKTPEAVMSLIKLGVDEIFTPYADDIGKDLAERFKIKSLKLR